MSHGVGSVALESVSSDMLRESLLDDTGMASVSSSAPPMDGGASSGDTSKPVSFSPGRRRQKHLFEAVWHMTCDFESVAVILVLITSSAGLDEEQFGFAL